MQNNDLIKIWKEGNMEMLKNRRFERSELEAFLKPKVSKAALNLNLNILVYMAAQLAAMAIMGFDFYIFRSNPVVLTALIPMFIVCSSFFGYGVFLLSYIWQINHNNFDLITSINRRVKIYRTHYEAWMWIGAVSLLLLVYALNMLTDNDQGTYHIYHPVVFTVGSLSVILFIYIVQKVAQFIAIRQIGIYLTDLQNDVLEGSYHLEETKKQKLVIFIILCIILIITFVWGLIRAYSI